MKEFRYLFLLLLLVSFQAALISCSVKNQSKAKEPDLPNIILMMGDDHGWDEVGYNGHPFVKTPVLDEMAATGLRFDRFYSGHSSCSPTRGSFLTGRHPNRYGTFNPGWSLRPEEITIAKLLKKKGYACAHFGKWHVGPVKKSSPTSPGAMGFDESLAHDNFFELNPVLSKNGEEPRMYEGESSQILVDAAKEFISRKKQDDQPFLVVIWFGSPHEPYSGLPEDLSLYDNLPDSLSSTEVALTSNETGSRVKRPLRDVLRERYAEITAMDRSIGDLRTHLKDESVRENTILFYCGDNGTPTSAARTGMTIRAEKGSLYEGGILVPGVLEWPAKISSPEVSGLIANTSDILPTLAGLTGAGLPQRPLDGLNLATLLESKENYRPEPMFFWKFEIDKVFEDPQPYIEQELQEGTTPLVKKMNGKFTRNFRNYKYDVFDHSHIEGERAVIDNQYKLVFNEESGVELYDILNDRNETINIADQYPVIVEKLKTQLTEWQHSVLKSLNRQDY